MAAPNATDQWQVATPNLHNLFARAKEAEGRFEEAAASFESAKNYDNVARLCLLQLHTPEKAFALVRLGLGV